MPGFHVQLGILAVADRSPTGFEHAIDHRLGECLVDDFLRNPVNSRAQSLIRDDGLADVAGRNVYVDGLSRRGNHGGHQRCHEQEIFHGHIPPPMRASLPADAENSTQDGYPGTPASD